MSDRRLDWDACWNVRDLGGLEASGGAVVRRGALVRGDCADRLSAAGWRALWEHGVRTVIDLRNDDELREDAAPRPPALETLRLPLDCVEDREFWDVWASGPQFGTPLYYGPHLDRFPERSARVLAAIARARPGGVLVHCVGGRDRTGQMTILVLALCGVPVEAIAADYELSAERIAARCHARGKEDENAAIERFLAASGTTAAELIGDTLADRDVPALLRAGGLTGEDVAALRKRLLHASSVS